MKVDDKVRAPVDDKYQPGIVTRVEDLKGFRHQYPYQKIWVEFADESTKVYLDYEVIPFDAEAKAKKETTLQLTEAKGEPPKKRGRPKKS